MVAAIPEAVVNTGAFCAFIDALKPEYESEVLKWLEMVIQWEQDSCAECPYDVTEPGMLASSHPLFSIDYLPDITMAKVKKALAEEDHKREMSGGHALLSTASSIIIEGLDIEDS
ncbi:hypothetical protein V5O48_016255 [Marasmius crinis-equi]|uniref:Uncharacterized protein n=1 Tax=Marasmius crinis-equi TaxID=585013 RepID=A0ABR3ESE2_9AGAR